MNLDARSASAKLLANWKLLHDPPRVPEHVSGFWSQLAPMERGAAFELLTGIIRRRLTLDAILAIVSSRPLTEVDPAVRAILWIGTYQLIFTHHVQDYAAIDSSVKIAANLGVARAGGFINAVLRSVQRLNPRRVPQAPVSRQSVPLDLQSVVVFDEKLFPDPVSHFLDYWSAAGSAPHELVSELMYGLAHEATAKLLVAANQRPPVICRIDRPTAAAEIPGLHPHKISGYARVEGTFSPQLLAAIDRGDISPQDPTAGLAVRLLLEAALPHPKSDSPDSRSSLHILDVCAGKGTKSVQLAMRGCDVTASDIAPEKLEILQQRERRIATGRIKTVAIEALSHMPPENFDAVLVDVPCSNTGVLARRPEVRWRLMDLSLDELTDAQEGLLTRGAALAKDLLVFSTCSVLKAENEDNIRRFLATPNGSHWRIAREHLTMPTGDPQNWQDGGYVAVLKRISA